MACHYPGPSQKERPQISLDTLYLNEASCKGTLEISMIQGGVSSKRHYILHLWVLLMSAFPEVLPLIVIFISLFIFFGGLTFLNQPHFIISIK